MQQREIYLPKDRGYKLAPVYDRYGLAPGARLSGPLILRERESTIVVARPADVEILADGSVSITLEGDADGAS